MTKFFGTAALSAVVAGAFAAPASAQMPPPQQDQARPNPGLFANNNPGNDAQLLTFQASVGAGYDGNIATATTGVANGANLVQLAAPGSRTTDATASLNYSRNSKTLSLQSSVGGWANYYDALNQPLLDGANARVALAWQITTRSSLTFSESVADQPLYVLFPVAVAPDQLNLPVQDAPVALTNAGLESQLTSWTMLEFSQRLTERLTASIGGAYSGIRQVTEAPGISTATGFVGLSYQIAKGFGVQVGYGEIAARYVFGSTVQKSTSSSINGGLTFNRALSLTRHTHLSFDFGTTALRYAGQSTVYLNGDALLTRDIGRSWEATLGYSRNAGFVAPFAAPIFADSLGIGLKGLVSSRVSFNLGAGISHGSVGIAGPTTSLSSDYGTVGADFALSKTLAVKADYTYLWYDLGNNVALPIGVARRVDRQSVRVALDVWVPLMRALRSPDVAR